MARAILNICWHGELAMWHANDVDSPLKVTSKCATIWTLAVTAG